MRVWMVRGGHGSVTTARQHWRLDRGEDGGRAASDTHCICAASSGPRSWNFPMAKTDRRMMNFVCAVDASCLVPTFGLPNGEPRHTRCAVGHSLGDPEQWSTGMCVFKGQMSYLQSSVWSPIIRCKLEKTGRPCKFSHACFGSVLVASKSGDLFILYSQDGNVPRVHPAS